MTSEKITKHGGDLFEWPSSIESHGTKYFYYAEVYKKSTLDRTVEELFSEGYEVKVIRDALRIAYLIYTQPQKYKKHKPGTLSKVLGD